ncbi:MAG: tetratricopeptide repeat protein [bacterium]|nr:tetratricopeptide repeat protein [bacterium]
MRRPAKLIEQDEHYDLVYLAFAHSNRGNTYLSLAHYDEALADCDKAIAIRTRLVDGEGRRELVNDLAGSLLARSIAHFLAENHQESRTDLQRAHDLLEQPTTPRNPRREDLLEKLTILRDLVDTR